MQGEWFRLRPVNEELCWVGLTEGVLWGRLWLFGSALFPSPVQGSIHSLLLGDY